MAAKDWKGTRAARKAKVYTDLGLGEDGTLRVGMVSLEARSRGEAMKREARAAHMRRIASSGGKAAQRRFEKLQLEQRRAKAHARAVAKGMPEHGWLKRPELERSPARIVLSFPTPDAVLTLRDIMRLSGLTKPQISATVYQNRPDLFEKIANAEYEPPAKPTFEKGIDPKHSQYLWGLSAKGVQAFHDWNLLKDMLS
jgi:predicted phage gp36 major capsid-like protein